MKQLNDSGHLLLMTGSKYAAPGSQDGDDERGAGLQEFLEILRRRKLALLVPMVVLFGIALAIAFTMPPLYRSTATILIEQQEIPPDMVRSTVSSYAEERITMITQRVLTTDNIGNIVKKFGLYPELRGEPVETVARRVRRHFDVEMVQADRGRRWGTVAFKISYDSESPQIAQKVTSELASLYLEENRVARTESATNTTRFLNREAERLGAEIDELEAKIAKFKEANMGRLPEQLGLNLTLVSRTEEQLADVSQRIRALEDRKIHLEAAMAQVEAMDQVNATSGSGRQGAKEATSPRERLAALRLEKVRLSARYAPDHPDLVQLGWEIDALEKEVGVGHDTDNLKARLKQRRAELATAMDRYSSQHPDVKRLQDEVDNLEQVLETADVQTVDGDSSKDPVYVELRAQYRTAESEIEALRAQRRELQAKLAAQEERISEIPQVEREYSLLVRDRENLIAKYQEIRAKLSNARVAKDLEEARKGERFTLIEPPRRPLEPFKPDRKKILALGFVGSVGGGIGMAVVSEFLNKAVFGAHAVTNLLGAPPLAVIPYIDNFRDRRRRLWKRLAAALAIFAALSLAAAFVHIYIKPLGVLWTAVVARLGELLLTVQTHLDALWAVLLTM